MAEWGDIGCFVGFFSGLIYQTTFLQGVIRNLEKSAAAIQLTPWGFELPTERHIWLLIKATASKNTALQW